MCETKKEQIEKLKEAEKKAKTNEMKAEIAKKIEQLKGVVRK